MNKNEEEEEEGEDKGEAGEGGEEKGKDETAGEVKDNLDRTLYCLFECTRTNQFILQEPIAASLPTNESSESSIDIVLWLQLEDVGSADASIVSVTKKKHVGGRLWISSRILQQACCWMKQRKRLFESCVLSACDCSEVPSIMWQCCLGNLTRASERGGFDEQPTPEAE